MRPPAAAAAVSRAGRRRSSSVGSPFAAVSVAPWDGADAESASSCSGNRAGARSPTAPSAEPGRVTPSARPAAAPLRCSACRSGRSTAGAAARDAGSGAAGVEPGQPDRAGQPRSPGRSAVTTREQRVGPVVARPRRAPATAGSCCGDPHHVAACAAARGPPCRAPPTPPARRSSVGRRGEVPLDAEVSRTAPCRRGSDRSWRAAGGVRTAARRRASRSAPAAAAARSSAGSAAAPAGRCSRWPRSGRCAPAPRGRPAAPPDEHDSISSPGWRPRSSSSSR